MLAPPASLATSLRGSAPSSFKRATSIGTAVSGNFAALLVSRARLVDGSSTWAIAPSRRSAAHAATLTMTSFTPPHPLTPSPCDGEGEREDRIVHLVFCISVRGDRRA